MHLPIRTFLAAVCILSLSPAAVRAQPTITLMGGATQYDLSGTGTAPFAAARAWWEVAPKLAVEPSLGWMRYDSQFEQSRTLWFPELHALFQPLSSRLSPYLGAGAGLAFLSGEGDSTTETTLSGALGALFDIDGAWGLRAELRVRAVDPWTGTTADWGVGVSRRF